VKVFDYNINSALKDNVKAFREGKRDFNPQELNDIKLYLLKYKDVLQTTQFFKGSLKEHTVVSCISEDYYEELFLHMLNNMAAAIAFILILSEKRIILKKNNKICNIDLCVLAKLLCDGECDETTTDLAGGKITDKFLKFTNTLTPC
jgi:hypothetical protein